MTNSSELVILATNCEDTIWSWINRDRDWKFEGISSARESSVWLHIEWSDCSYGQEFQNANDMHLYMTWTMKAQPPVNQLSNIKHFNMHIKYHFPPETRKSAEVSTLIWCECNTNKNMFQLNAYIIIKCFFLSTLRLGTRPVRRNTTQLLSSIIGEHR